MTEAKLDPNVCPLCSGPNGCGMAQGLTECWCFDAKIPADVLAEVPEAAKGTVCVCATCAAGGGQRTRKLKIQP